MMEVAGSNRKTKKWSFSSAFHISAMLLTVASAGCLATCGCDGTNQVYVMYKPPVTGWFELVPEAYFHRNLSVEIYGAGVEYFLHYTKTGKWLVLERSARSTDMEEIGLFKMNASDIRFLCPSLRCDCTRVVVKGDSFLSGKYYRYDVWQEETNRTVDIMCDEYKKIEDDPALVNYSVNITRLMKPFSEAQEISHRTLSKCIKKRRRFSGGAENVMKYRTSADVYLREDKIYNLSRTTEGDFWWITQGELVYAVSNHGAACLEHLPPHNQWQMTVDALRYDVQQKSLDVSCFVWDFPVFQ